MEGDVDGWGVLVCWGRMVVGFWLISFGYWCCRLGWDGWLMGESWLVGMVGGCYFFLNNPLASENQGIVIMAKEFHK